MSKGVLAFLGVANVSTMATIDSYSRTFHIPFINPSLPPGSGAHEHAFTIYMQPSYHEALIDLIGFYKWRTVFYLYDTNEGKDRCVESRSQISTA